MFAVVAQRHNQDSREGMVLLATARTLKAAQKKWQTIQGGEASKIQRRKCPLFEYIAILTPDGLVNFHGDKFAPGTVGYAVARMGIEY